MVIHLPPPPGANELNVMDLQCQLETSSGWLLQQALQWAEETGWLSPSTSLSLCCLFQIHFLPWMTKKPKSNTNGLCVMKGNVGNPSWQFFSWLPVALTSECFLLLRACATPFQTVLPSLLHQNVYRFVGLSSERSGLNKTFLSSQP